MTCQWAIFLSLLFCSSLARTELQSLRVDSEKIPTTYRTLTLVPPVSSEPRELAMLRENALESHGQKLRTYPRKNPMPVAVSILSNEEIGDLFSQLQPLLPFSYVGDCCHDRAQMMALAAAKIDITLAKVFVIGDLHLLRSHVASHRDASIAWAFHVAPVVLNQQGQIIVLDPSMADHPLALPIWLAQFSQSSAREVYLTTSKTYAPQDISNPPLEFKNSDNENAELSLMGCASIQEQRLRDDR